MINESPISSKSKRVKVIYPAHNDGVRFEKNGERTIARREYYITILSKEFLCTIGRAWRRKCFGS